ncbi:MAG: MFS transporter [Terriglobales bacterium]
MSTQPPAPSAHAATAPAPPFRWRVTSSAQRSTLVASGLGWMLDAFDVMLYSLVLTHLITAFGMSKTTAGFLNTLTLIASAVGSLIIGVLADRWGRRRMLSFSILIYSLFTFACGFSNSVTMLATLRFFLGLGMGGEWNAGAALVAETWPSHWRGRALGIVQSSWAIGYALAALVAGLVLAHASWRWVFFVGVAPALVTLWIQKGVPEPELWERQRDGPPATPHSELWRRATPRLLALLAMNTCGMFAWWGMFTWLPAYLMLPIAQGGRGFALLGSTEFLLILNLCGMLPGYLLFGVIADRWGRKRSIVAYLVIAAALVPWFEAARQPGKILLTASLVAFFGTGFFTGSGILGSELFPTPIRATALGASYNVARGLSAFAPFVIGGYGERHGLSGAFGLCGIAFALAAVSALFVPETRGWELE